MPRVQTSFPHSAFSYGIPNITGTVLFVNSAAANASNGNDGLSPDKPLATLDGAISHANLTANNGDLILVMPNHSETVTGAAGITADVAGVTIRGLGNYNQRPRFLMDGATTVDVLVSAADVTFENLVFASGHADVVRCFRITAAGCSLINIEFDDNVVDENWLTPIKATSTTDNNADGLRVIGCRWTSADAAGLEFIEINADLKHLIVRDNVVVHEGTASALILCATGKDIQYCDVRNNFLAHKMTANALLVNNDTTANSGIIASNRVGHADVTTTHNLGITALGCRLFDNLSVSTDSLSGFVLPAIDVDS